MVDIRLNGIRSRFVLSIRIRRFVHSTCDIEADLNTYHSRKEQNPDYEYNCPQCKTLIQNGRLQALRRNSSIDDESMSASQESLYNDEQTESISGAASATTETSDKLTTDFGMGKGKPLSATKMIAKKRLAGGVSAGMGRPKGSGKFSFQKKPRVAEFGRKRGPKAKMRGIFGVPGLGLQRPTWDANTSSKTDDEPGVENRLVLCSAKDKFVLTQDICVMCGAIGTDQEGCLISCVQCGQCYHPYCVTVKVTKVILQKGWRCLDCTVCEGCGQKHDEPRLILCDDCDISYHIYCMDPPLDHVPNGTWKCKWCAVCQKCGTNTPGTNCTWQNSYTECGPCHSQSQCASCTESYEDGALIIQCQHCDRWLHCVCDSINNEEEAEKCIDENYKCLLCRPKDTPPPHLVPKKKVAPLIVPKALIALNASKSSSVDSDSVDAGSLFGLDGNHLMDGICLSESGLQQIKALQIELVRKKRKNRAAAEPPPPKVKDKVAGIMAAIESVVSGGTEGSKHSNEDVKMEPLDSREEAEIYKDGMVWDRADASAPEGFTLCTLENGTVVLRKKRQRNLQKLGIGGFTVRNRMGRKDGKDDLDDNLDGTMTHVNDHGDKRKKQVRKKVKSKLIETYPSYLQEAFFGKGLLEPTKPKFETSSDEDDNTKVAVPEEKTIKLSSDELKLMETMRTKQQKILEETKAAAAASRQQQQQQTLNQQQQLQQQNNKQPTVAFSSISTTTTTATTPVVPATAATPAAAAAAATSAPAVNIQATQRPNVSNGLAAAAIVRNEVDAGNAETLKDILPGDLLDHDLVSQIMNDDDELTKTSAQFDDLTSDREGGDRKDEFADILNNFEFSKDVEDMFKGLTDESQASHEHNIFL